MKRFLIYALVGIIFGLLDILYSKLMGVINTTSIVVITVLILGIWLVPAVPVVLHELKVSASKYKAALATVVVWSFAIISYYLWGEFLYFVFVGVDYLQNYHISNHAAANYWIDLAYFFVGRCLESILEWLWFAVITGFISGYIIAVISVSTKRIWKE